MKGQLTTNEPATFSENIPRIMLQKLIDTKIGGTEFFDK
jgi:hypothetical protein